MTLSNEEQDRCESFDRDYSDLRALFINCTLKSEEEQSHTRGLINLSAEIMRANDVTVDTVRATSYNLPPGVQPDMGQHGFDDDDWPILYDKVIDADIVVIGTPIWLGEKSSVCSRVIERMYGNSHDLNEAGQYSYYGRVGGCLVTGNEDGVKHCAMNILYSLQHLGFTIPPQADAGWIGEVGPGPSYLDEESDAEENDFTNRNTSFMTWNLMHTASMLKKNGGMPAHGNRPDAWDAGCDVDFPNPEHRG